jgi:hypothetical protein
MDTLDFSGEFWTSTQEFPNGFLSWAETHHEVVAIVTRTMDQDNYPVFLEKIQMEKGSGGIWEFCIAFTFQFEQAHKGREWEGDWFDTLEETLLNLIEG